MRTIFADTFYWVALLNPNDSWYLRVIDYSQVLSDSRLILSDGIIDEIFAHYSKMGTLMRSKSLELYQSMLKDPKIQIVAYTPQIRKAGIELYRLRPDKGYSLTDCISMVIMKELNIVEVLTHDRHFTQEGFTVLF
jgi:predicted nucleic acid-binding protein